MAFNRCAVEPRLTTSISGWTCSFKVTPALLALGRGDGFGAHDGAAVDLREAAGVEARHQLAQRGANQMLARRRDDS